MQEHNAASAVGREGRLRVRSAVAAAIALLLGTLLSGCAAPVESSPTGTPETPETSPAVQQAYDCLVDRGWKPILTWDGIEVNSDIITKEQLPLFDADSDECWGEIEARTAAMTDDEIRAVYAAELSTRECLIALGIEVEDAPTEQSYVDAFFGDRWMAYGVADLGRWESDEAKWREVNAKCPQPSGWLGVE